VLYAQVCLSVLYNILVWQLLGVTVRKHQFYCTVIVASQTIDYSLCIPIFHSFQKGNDYTASRPNRYLPRYAAGRPAVYSVLLLLLFLTLEKIPEGG